MQEVIVHEGPHIELIWSPIPKPGPDQVVIKVEVAGCNPKDYKTYWFPEPLNQGNDLPATSSKSARMSLNSRVDQLQTIDFNVITRLLISTGWRCLAATSAALGLYRGLQLPQPWQPSGGSSGPLLIYGASSAVGAFAVKLARLSDIHPIIAVSGVSGAGLFDGLLDHSHGDSLLNYMDYKDSVGLVTAIKKASDSSKRPLFGVFDAISEHNSHEIVLAALNAFSGSHTRLATTLPYPEDALAQNRFLKPYLIVAADVHNGRESKAGGQDFGCVMFRMFGRWLQEGRLKGHPYEIRHDGLRGVQGALEDLKDEKVRGKKLLVRVKDT
ncbi:MAG: hypothetical protein Q9166_001220 [cf. Caloplaca sp. 2 TL-2023]